MDIGHPNPVSVTRHTDTGVWVADTSGEEIPLILDQDTFEQRKDSLAVGTSVDVFVYTSAAGAPLASLEMPCVYINQCALLEVVSSSDAGAWLNWGLSQDLLLPRSEMSQPVSSPEVYVYVFRDDMGRLCATTRFHYFFEEHAEGLKRWQKVKLTIAAVSRLGFKAIINDEYLGLLYADEVFQTLKPGDQVDGYVKSIREDRRIDLTLYPERSTIKDELGQRILANLERWGGESSLTDRSSPEEIQAQYEVSKKNYKRALSSLYKARLIEIDDNRIKLVKS